jgi:mRNA interferase RelE/StbE
MSRFLIMISPYVCTTRVGTNPAAADGIGHLHDRVAKLDDPRSIGEALHGSRLGEFWKYRMSDYRLICKIEDNRLVVLILRVGHRREIYR